MPGRQQKPRPASAAPATRRESAPALTLTKTRAAAERERKSAAVRSHSSLKQRLDEVRELANEVSTDRRQLLGQRDDDEARAQPCLLGRDTQLQGACGHVRCSRCEGEEWMMCHRRETW